MAETSNLTLRYATLDVFTRTSFAGNPLAVVSVPPALQLSQDQKQIIAREFNYSETVFLHERLERAENACWPIDIFLTTAEVPFAGHPTIGTACHVLSQLEARDDVVKGAFITKAGRIELEYSRSEQLAKASIPHDVHAHQNALSQARLLEMQPTLAPYASQLPAASPVVSIVRGMTFALVQLDSIEALGSATTGSFRVDVTLDKDWDQSFVALYFFVCLPDSADGTRNLRTRMVEGSLEDPATGSAASGLASYLSLQEDVPGQTLKYAITQGVELGRKSDIGVEITLGQDEGIETVLLSGSAVQVMEGSVAL
ncbi:uncharacterized protein K452DRAFT_304261 [Aplosporella prunicola CBS 121167]|uniref:Phenazine biosynthesis protein n=1 Tax=Aplosporella prunicola CBS 121167 TaxID=1176127 RepID=A0A6A6BTV0_9PEZI|nr:uncharacterized protein K452DRAFT_304261 [Aplosporella prunicola CBS 121167]KAF2147420.1 hypothetical protein K452DRAFT_304261 [Aplosporella prunicola CBS 121167]